MPDKLFFYVSGRSTGRVTGLATLRRDGFASVDADETGGTLTTRLLTFKGRYPFVNIDAAELRAELLDEPNHVLPPFAKENCAPLKTNSIIAPLRWTSAHDIGGGVWWTLVTAR